MSGRRDHATLADLTEIVRSLTQAGPHSQPYVAGWKYSNRTGAIYREHKSNHESLLNQLRAAVVHRAQGGYDRKFPGGTSRGALPHFDPDALDRLEAIHRHTVEWTERLTLPLASNRIANQIHIHIAAIEKILNAQDMQYPAALAALEVLRQVTTQLRNAIEPNLRDIAVAAQAVPQEVLEALVSDLRDWRTWCRIIAGWQEPLMRPNVPCINCGAMPGEHAGLRIRIDGASGSGGMVADAAVKVAVCLSCDRTWDTENIGLLAAEISRQQAEAEQAKKEAEQDDGSVQDGQCED